MTDQKPLAWSPGVKSTVTGWPEASRREFGRQLRSLQYGQRPPDSSVMKRDRQGTVLELRLDAYRGAVLVSLPDRLVVVAAWKKDSAKGIKTRKPVLDSIEDHVRSAIHESKRHH